MPLPPPHTHSHTHASIRCAFTRSFIQSVNQSTHNYLLSAYHTPDTILSTGDTAEAKVLALTKLIFKLLGQAKYKTNQ